MGVQARRTRSRRVVGASLDAVVTRLNHALVRRYLQEFKSHFSRRELLWHLAYTQVKNMET